ncbi:hypothetical protein KUK88_000006 [Vibrio parahaemolyticus]|nr:hypothetical protein [Vibrio parahaemolyticus]
MMIKSLMTSIFVLIGLSACSSKDDVVIETQNEKCSGVYGLVAKEITAKYDLEESRSFATKLLASAEKDIEALGKGSANVDLNASLGSTLKGAVTTKSNVTTDFFQQDQSFVQAACWFDNILARELSESDQREFEKYRQELAKNRVDYLDVITGLKKN